MLAAIIVAGGSSQRMGFDKTFALLCGKPVVAHSIGAFEATRSVTEIIVVGREERLADLRQVVAEHAFSKVRSVISGGVHRQDSVANGLREVGEDVRYVAVHDAARPLIAPEQIEQVFEQSRRTGAAALASPVTDTLKQADASLFVSGSLSRVDVFAMETPQIFERELLLRAYAYVTAEGLSITDEVSAIERLKEKVLLVPNHAANFKITYPSDLALAESLLSARMGGSASALVKEK